MAVQQPFSNPIAPPDKELTRRATGQLSNDDFRQLLMTPRASATATTTNAVAGGGGGEKEAVVSEKKQSNSSSKPNKGKEFKPRRKSANSEWLAELRKEEDERIAEWSKNYRDRAKERREGVGSDVPVGDDTLTATSGYRAVAPNSDPSRMAEQRKQLIANSKYLGGDMEHTHLVKGLDYALLQKVRSEMSTSDQEVEELKKLERKKKEREEREKKRTVSFNEEASIKSKLAKDIYSALFQTKAPEKNEFFLPGRMAYVFELDDEYEESDIPTTLIRSKADCPMLESQTTLTTNDIVINKLTQILSYLRQGSKDSRKMRKKDKEVHAAPINTYSSIPAPKKSVVKEQKKDSIFPELDEYDFNAAAVPSDLSKRQQLFFSKTEPSEDFDDIRRTTKEFVKAVGRKYAGSTNIAGEEARSDGPLPSGWSAGEVDRSRTRSSGTEPTVLVKKAKASNVGFGGLDQDHYAECYPGGMEEVDATVNSDDETDFSKMDMGNRKGPVKRWDFENEEDYGNYQSSREALPKAAFQYGVKMNDGRKTRRQGAKNEKAKLDREWQQISQILQKRKSMEMTSDSKRAKTSN